jgi:hypothetical protein
MQDWRAGARLPGILWSYCCDVFERPSIDERKALIKIYPGAGFDCPQSTLHRFQLSGIVSMAKDACAGTDEGRVPACLC